MGLAADADHPRHWLGPSPLIDLEDPKLRLRVRSLTQLCKTEREKALAIYGYVKRLPLARRVKLSLRTARQVHDAGRGDGGEKATLLVAMLRIAGIPARMRIVMLSGEVLRGITSSLSETARPQLEVWLHDRWLRTDTFVYDGECMASARQRLKELDWEWGFGIHVSGAMVWNGYEDAFLGGVPTECDLMVVREAGVFDDPLQYHSSSAYAKLEARATRLIQSTLLAPMFDRAWRRLRQQHVPADARLHKTY
jgi:Transglutaminase-like superfamily